MDRPHRLLHPLFWFAGAARVAWLASAALMAGGCAERLLEPRAPTPGAFHFTVKTFNVELRHYDDPATIAAVGEADADIVCLQEMTPRWRAAVEAEYRARYPHMLHHTPEEGSSGGLAVLSRFPLTDLGIVHEPNGWHPAWLVAADTPGGRLQLLVVHLRAPLNGRSSAVTAYLSVEEDHLAQIERLHAASMEDLPTLILGDFNEDDDGAAVGYLEARGYVNTLPLFHPGQWTWRYRSLAGQFNAAFDHIFYDQSFAPLDARVLRSGNSDHLPVLAHLELAPAASPR